MPPENSGKSKETSRHDFIPISDMKIFLPKAKEQFEEKWKSDEIPRAKMNDFERFRTLGAGAFGRVILVKHKSTNTYYAMKMLDKSKIIATKQLDHAFNEMKILISVNFPFLAYMQYVMKDNSYIYFVLPFIIGGEMFGHLRTLGKFKEEQARFYAVQVCLALEYFHFLDIVYRDLKPENIVIDGNGYLKVIDMGFCKIIKGRTWTFCGTPEYLAPEIILSKGYGKSVDWWSYGVLLYEMSAGYPPFTAHNPVKIYEKIVVGKYKSSSSFSSDLKDLISHILQIDAQKRYGNLKNGVDDIKNHKWFKNVDWLAIANRKITAPYLPKYADESDTSNFDYHQEEHIKIAEKDKFEKEFEKF